MTELIGTPILRELANIGAVSRLVALRVDGGYILSVSYGSFVKTLSAQRGGVRIFRTLDALAAYVEGIGVATLELQFQFKDALP